jgi:pterin-4a-carbinolamine dehydratase
MEKKKLLGIAILKEKLEKVSGKKVIFEDSIHNLWIDRWLSILPKKFFSRYGEAIMSKDNWFFDETNNKLNAEVQFDDYGTNAETVVFKEFEKLSAAVRSVGLTASYVSHSWGLLVSISQ